MDLSAFKNLTAFKDAVAAAANVQAAPEDGKPAEGRVSFLRTTTWLAKGGSMSALFFLVMPGLSGHPTLLCPKTGTLRRGWPGRARP